MNPASRALGQRLRMLKQIKGWVRGYLGPEPATLKNYSLAYKREFSGRWRPADTETLFAELQESEILYGGDFHGFSQAQRTHLRILRSLPASRTVVMALEIFQSRHQRLVDRFLEGSIDENDFLSAIHWEKDWGFPWAHYRPLLELARKRGWKVVALNRHFKDRTAETLKRRDRHAASILAALCENQPGALVYVVFGDLHIAGSHLPRMVEASLKRKPKAIFLFQNSERLYFTLAKKGLEASVHLLKRGNRYCVLSSPPWVKWQSYLMFLENSLDRDLVEDVDEIDLTAYIRQSILVLGGDLRLKIEAADLAAYGPGDDSLPYALKRRLSARELKVAKSFIEMGRSFYVPKGGLFFVSRSTVNHTAGLAGDYLQARLSGRTRVLWSMPADFTRLVWLETLSFFLSKLINHRRKPERLRDIKAFAPKLSREVLLLALNAKIESLSFRFGPEWKPRVSKPRNPVSYYLAAKMAGSLFGETLHTAFRAGHVGVKDVVKWLSVDVDGPAFLSNYRNAHRKLQGSPRSRIRAEKSL